MKTIYSKTRQLTDHLIEKISSGELSPGEKLPSERTIQEIFNVGRITVRRAFEELMKKKLISRKVGAGTFVTADAPSLLFELKRSEQPPKCTLKVGFVMHVRWIFSSVFQDFYDSLLDSSPPEIKYSLYFHDNLQKKIYLEDNLEVIIVDHGFGDHELKSFEKNNIKIISFRDTEAANYITTDDVAGGYLAGKTLAEYGHRKIGAFRYMPIEPEWWHRNEGLMKAAREFGLEVLFATIDRNSASSNIYSGIDYLLSLDRGITALVTPDDYKAIEVCEILTSKNIKVPENISVIGDGDIYFAAHYRVPLTTIAQPFSKRILLLVEVLKNYITTGDLTIREKVIPTVVKRKSVKSI